MKPPLLRRNYFSNPRLQWRLIFVANVLALMTGGLIATLAMYTQTGLGNLSALVARCTQDASALAYIAQQEQTFLRLCLLVGLLQFLLLNLMAVILSHRIAGPLYRLEHHLNAVGDGGEPTDVRFRKGDLYAELATACNRVMARMRAG